MTPDTSSGLRNAPNGLGFDPELAQKALQVLAEQGGPDDIAAFLQERGIKGRQRRANSCPVAVYLRSEVPGISPGVGGTVERRRTIWDGEHWAPTWQTQVPESVNLFIRGFDNNEYPDLVAGGVS